MKKINAAFISALSEAVKAESENVVIFEHEYSKHFEHKMQVLIKRHKTPYYKMINTARKRVACFILALFCLLSGTALAFDEVRYAISDFFVSVFSDHSLVTSEEEDAPQTIEDIYKITYPLDGYEENVWSDDSISRCVDYLKGNDFIGFEQYTKTGFVMGANTEGAVIEKIEINGHEGICFVDNHNYRTVIWDNGDYVFCIFTNLPYDVLVKIAESVKK